MQAFQPLLVLAAMISMAQSSPVEKFERGIRPHPQDQQHFIVSPGSTRKKGVFHIHNVEYWATINEDTLMLDPDWEPSKPLPLSLADAEKLARKELRKLIPNDLTWEVTGLSFRSIHVDVGDIDAPQLRVKDKLKWYLQVEMQPRIEQSQLIRGQPVESFCVFVSLSGRVGEIQRQPQP